MTKLTNGLLCCSIYKSFYEQCIHPCTTFTKARVHCKEWVLIWELYRIFQYAMSFCQMDFLLVFIVFFTSEQSKCVSHILLLRTATAFTILCRCKKDELVIFFYNKYNFLLRAESLSDERFIFMVLT